MEKYAKLYLCIHKICKSILMITINVLKRTNFKRIDVWSCNLQILISVSIISESHMNIEHYP